MEINLVNYLNSKEQLNNITISELTKLVEKYPYCAAAHMILAKKLHGRNDKAWIEVLKKAAIYASDIDSLEKYIYADNTIINTGTNTVSDTKPSLKNNNTGSLNTGGPLRPAPSTNNQNRVDVAAKLPTDAGRVKEPYVFNKDSLVKLKDTFANTGLKPTQNPNIINKVVENNIDSQTASPGPNNNKNSVYRQESKHINSTSSVADKNQDTSVERAFSEWLDLNSYDNYESTIAYTPKIIKHKIRISDIEGINLINNGSVEEIEVEFDSDNQQDVIIGDFIAANPTISIYNNDPVNALKAEDVIIDDSLKVVSENLVDIYMSQGLHKEAVNMCRQLISKKPEKKIYYDKKLEEIKNIMVKIR